MTQRKYSPSNKGFYDDTFKDENGNPTYPNDCIDITDEVYNQLMDDQANNLNIYSDINGNPVSGVYDLSNHYTGQELIDRKFQGAFYSISAGEI